MRAALYVRVSSDKQAREGDSIPAQIDGLRRYAADNGMQIAGEYVDEGLSGTKFSERDDLQRMLADVRAGKIDIILFTKLDRFYRSIRHYTATQAVLDDCGVVWRAIWEPVYDTSTPAGRLVVNQMMSIAQFEAENTGQRIRQVFAYKARRGEVISGSVTPGYSIVNKHLVINDDAADVRRAFEVYDACGNLAQTVREMSGSCLPSSVTGLKALLRRRIYTGESYGVPDYCPPIVDRELFERVQLLLDRNIKSSQKRVYLFSGLLRCAECGAVMAGYSRIKRGKRLILYRCAKHYQRQIDKCPNAKVITESVLEKDLLSRLPDLLLQQVRVYEEKKTTAADLERKKAALRGRLERLKVLFLDGAIDLSEYKKDRADFLTQLDALDAVPDPEPPAALVDLAGLDVRQIYAGFSQDERRMFWRGIIREIRFSKSREYEFDFL